MGRKHRATVSAWHVEALVQATTAVARQLPFAVLHGHGQPYADCLAVVCLADLAALLETAPASGAAPIKHRRRRARAGP